MEEFPNRKDRRAAGTKSALTQAQYRKLADRFIDVANRENKTIGASDVQLAFLYAAARYNAHVGKNVFDVPNHEEYVQELTKTYQQMLRANLADPKI